MSGSTSSGVSAFDGSPQATQPFETGYVAGDSVVGYRQGANARFPRNPPTQRAVMQTNAAGVAVWTFPTPYAAGVVPVISLAKVNPSADMINLDITAVTNLAVTVRASKMTVALGVLTLSVPATLSIHMKADQP